ncbi:ras-specific guanine nucleotide-releasing factor 1-like, partial [Limulus polyphemus]|uniref:Ras-specific guanine nucleotide-releasing factor 1-like n=1 Tax=Limulus polyphemus TaxID=6850 RepID=A0ABM1TL90_LIMPO
FFFKVILFIFNLFTRNDPRLFKDDVDIRFSRTLNSCKVPQIRYASPERLFERLTDLRFLSIDFLNTFLLTYRVFTDAVTVLKALKKVHYNPELQMNTSLQDSTGSLEAIPGRSLEAIPTELGGMYVNYEYSRRISTESGASDLSEPRDREQSLSTSDALLNIYQTQPLQAFRNQQHWRLSHRKFEEEQKEQSLKRIRDTPTISPGIEPLTIPVFQPSTPDFLAQAVQCDVDNGSEESEDEKEVENSLLAIPCSSVQSSHSCDTLTPDGTETNGPNTPTNLSSTTSTATLVGSAWSSESPRTSPIRSVGKRSSCETESGSPSTTPRSSFQTDSTILSTPRTSFQTDSTILSTPRSSFQTESTILSTPRSSFQYPDSPQHSSKAGVVVTSSRASTRRSSKSSAAAAFAAATAGSSNPPEPLSQSQSRAGSNLPSAVGADLKIPNAKMKRESMISTAATMRVLNVLRHWVSKHSQDFENDPKLLHLTTEFLEELTHNTNLLPAEHKAAAHILQMITKQDQHVAAKLDLDVLLAPPTTPSKETVEELSALELAEEMTYLDHQIFVSIRSEEFLGQAWMKADKTFKAPNIILMTRRFNHMNRLVVSEIMGAPEMSRRVCIIEKWATVADICRCLHNFNGVLQIISAFMNSSVFRLKKTWEKVSKTSKQTIDKLQILVAADGRFRNMRDALHRCDPPCIPYLGLYLTDLTFIEEGTPNFTEEGLLNFSKMRMIAHVIREIRHFQQTPYKIETNPKVTDYLLNDKRLMQDDELYQLSLCLEPRLSSKIVHPPSTSAFGSPRS